MLSAGYSDGAYYLAGYSVECGLKACIAKSTQRYDFPDKGKVNASYTHNVKDLIDAANLNPARKEQARKDAIFRINWDLVQQWSELSRYQRHEARAAEDLVNAVAAPKHGVLAWIKQHW